MTMHMQCIESKLNGAIFLFINKQKGIKLYNYFKIKLMLDKSQEFHFLTCRALLFETLNQKIVKLGEEAAEYFREGRRKLIN